MGLYLSKSLFLRGVQCEKSLWLKKHKSEVLSKPSDSTLARFHTGDDVGALACELFPNGEKIAFEDSTFEQKCEKTKKLIESGIACIYEATFSFEGILVMVDILQITPNGLIINEVKSSTSIKDVYLDDMSIQYFVIKNLGYKIAGANLIHIDNTYERGESLKIEKLFVINDILEQIKPKIEQIPSILENLEQIIADSNEPDIDIGQHCFSPYECDCVEYCWEQKGIDSARESVFDIAKLSFDKKMALYKKGEIYFDEISNLSSFDKNQNIQIRSSLEQGVYIDRTQIGEFLSTLSYPIYHLDFETFQQAVPEYQGIRPYMQIPFQYSIHKDDGKGGLEHFEFLGESRSDPRYALAKKLVADISQNACILAYNASFEKGVIENLAKQFLDLKEPLLAIKDNIKDLMIPFKNKAYYHYKMRGSYSIKYVLPALCPDFENAYKNLDLVHNGSEAMEVFGILSKMPLGERERYRKALLEYCKLDTLAMVKILAHLIEVAD